MDFDHAIAAHSAWKGKLAKYLEHPDHSLQAAEIALDDHCELGKWIAGEGKQFANLPEYSTLKTEHSHFHKAAAGAPSYR
ncbi:MAG: CZB domain-containing protein [Candidatus Acidiferrales bacterium]